MKKILSSLIFISISLPLFTLASNIIGNDSDKPIAVAASFTIPDQWNLQYINLGFCDEEMKNVSKYNVTNIRPWQTKQICMIFANASSGDTIDITSSFVDSEIVDGKIACSIGVNTGISLTSLLSFNPKDYTFTLAPQEKLVRKASITIPKDMTWTLNGCIWYQLDLKKPDNYTGLFFVVRRHVGLMRVNITWDVYNFGWLDDIKYIYKDNQIFVLKIIAWMIWLLLVYYISVSFTWKKKEKQAKK